MVFPLWKRIGLLALVTDLAVSAGIGLSVREISWKRFREGFVESRLSLARAAAGSLEGEPFAKLRGTAALQDPAYARARARLRRVFGSEKHLSHLYTLSPRADGGGLEYGLAAATAENDTLWVESGIVSFSVVMRPDGACETDYEGGFFSGAAKGRIRVSLDREGGGTILRVEGREAAVIASANPRAIAAGSGFLDRDRRETDRRILLDYGPVTLHMTLSLRGEPERLPGMPYLAGEGSAAGILRGMNDGADWADWGPGEGRGGLSIYSAFRDGAGRPAGVVVMEIPRTEMDALRRPRQIEGFVSAGICFVLLFVLALSFTAYLFNPIARISTAAASAAAGKLDVRVAVRGRGELGRLAGSINEMVKSLARDREERERIEARLEVLADHDPLTGLLNRRSFFNRFSETLKLAGRSRLEKTRALMLLDLDRFKEVNDTLGHEAGDLVLRETVSRIRALLRTADLFFRQGGDEFMVVLTSLAAELDAAVVAEKLIAAMEEPIRIGGHAVSLGLSVGITLYPRDGENVDTLVRNANMALSEAKAQKTSYRFFTQELQEKAVEKNSLIAMLRRGVRDGEFELHYQPQVDRTGRLAGFEALLRWNNPKRGKVLPGSFIPAAEESGLIIPIGNWVIREACAAATRIVSEGLGGLSVSLNLSMKQFKDKGLVGTIHSALEAERVAADRVVFEITESLTMEDAEIMRTIHELHSQGIRFSIDDFGTGYSSLARLSELPVDEVKIDRSFLQGLPREKANRGVAKAIIAVAHELGMTVVAEGVEKAAQWDFLMEAGCDVFQGYLYSPPIPERDLSGFAARLSPGARP